MIELAGAAVPLAIYGWGFFIRSQLTLMEASDASLFSRVFGLTSKLRPFDDTTLTLQCIIAYFAFAINTYVFLSAGIPRIIAIMLLTIALVLPVLSVWTLLLPRVRRGAYHGGMIAFVMMVVAIHVVFVVVTLYYTMDGILYNILVAANILNTVNYMYLLTPAADHSEPPNANSEDDDDGAQTVAGYARVPTVDYSSTMHRRRHNPFAENKENQMMFGL